MDTPSPPPPFDEFADDDDEKRDYERIWRLLQRTDEERADAYDVDEEWAQVADRLDLGTADTENTASDVPPRSDRAQDRPARSPGSSAIGRGRRWARALTAVAIILCLVGGGALWWSQPASVTAAAGERTTVSLPDGSTVELNGGTTLEYPRGFSSFPVVGSSSRVVQLEGEAFFSVVKGSRPFRVETPNARVEVLGTEFNVRTRIQDDTPQTRVAVTAGTVRVAGTAHDAKSVVLDERGETSEVPGRDASPTDPTIADLKYVHAWRDGGFGLAEASLPTILRELEYRFGTSLRLGVPVAETDTMTLHYTRDARLEDVLRDVCIVQGLTYRETSQGYELVQD